MYLHFDTEAHLIHQLSCRTDVSILLLNTLIPQFATQSQVRRILPI